ncbi:MAG: hypothetical protein J6W56_12385 [Prevotella sp.]|nr:hypothetical protein [Prevotella sp.]
MRRKKLADLVHLAWLVMLVAIVACSEPSKEELVSLAAKGYYDHLIHGEYEQFMEGVHHADDPEYRSQLLENYRRFMAAQQSSHGGIREVRIVRAKTDTIQQYTNVFLTLCFGDSTNEEIVVPMVEQDGRWRMR